MVDIYEVADFNIIKLVRCGIIVLLQKYDFFLTFWFFHEGMLFFCMFARRMSLVCVSCVVVFRLLQCYSLIFVFCCFWVE